MFWVKVHLFVLVVIVQTIALFKETTLPYFPIEISRTAATGDLNKTLFPLGILSLGITFWMTGEFKLQYLLSWIGLFILSYFDDEKYFLLHMFGVFIMIVGVILIGLYSKTRYADLIIVLCAMIIYAVRVIMKLLVVMLLEVNANDMFNFIKIKQVIDQIMFAGICQYPLQTLTVFRICGVLQWIIFVMLVSII